MIPLISLFNHKGGVSKTTTAFNLGWALADKGKRVLIVDADPQCNLTGTVLGFDGVNDFAKFYKENPRANISACLAPVFQGSGEQLKPADIVPTTNSNLFLLAGILTSPKMRPRFPLRSQRALLYRPSRTSPDHSLPCLE